MASTAAWPICANQLWLRHQICLRNVLYSYSFRTNNNGEWFFVRKFYAKSRQPLLFRPFAMALLPLVGPIASSYVYIFFSTARLSLFRVVILPWLFPHAHPHCVDHLPSKWGRPEHGGGPEGVQIVIRSLSIPLTFILILAFRHCIRIAVYSPTHCPHSGLHTFR